ncbi:hypothetical protein F2Q70_00038498 [Brassica cretica]|uniref:Uncharacterized protein n=1 Tax=Brassica cretica TaxID=69181 RepID=A0A8S9K240_BRACR|nr:hypothetical protein F2Q70_00038498 [Brassica cretica]
MCNVRVRYGQAVRTIGRTTSGIDLRLCKVRELAYEAIRRPYPLQDRWGIEEREMCPSCHEL